ncbi:MAG: HD domain-containing protein, partial [Desulfobacterales bacterium]|nr:HD domain-containing protein [Desulfobacterales bacterium]
MRFRVESDDLEWILASEAKIPHNFFSDKDTRTLLIPKGARITEEIRKKIENRIDISGNPYIEIPSLEAYQDVLAECREPKEEEALLLLANAKKTFAGVLGRINGSKCISNEHYRFLKAFYQKYYEKIEDDALLWESIVNVMTFDIDKTSHITNVFFLACHFVNHYNDTHIRNFNVQKIFLGFLLHDIAKPEHHFSSQKKYNLQFVDFDAIKVHPQKGRKILLHKDSIKIPRESVDIVYTHHQRPSGGYPALAEG